MRTLTSATSSIAHTLDGENDEEQKGKLIDPAYAGNIQTSESYRSNYSSQTSGSYTPRKLSMMRSSMKNK